jgi:hypothetical protein
MVHVVKVVNIVHTQTTSTAAPPLTVSVCKCVIKYLQGTNGISEVMAHARTDFL